VQPLALVLTLVVPAAQAADDNASADPRAAKPGKVYQWQAADGLPYEYRVPEDYDPERGANLTLVLHGNGLDHRWTFWNHPTDEFRTDDIVVSPDGTTPLNGSNEFLGERKDAERVHALIAELEEIWKVRETFLYGHSQGSFFVFYYAGEFPEDVDGVCGHASGAWNWTKLSKKGHHQAIGVLHGTDDHIPYGQGWYAARWYRDEGYPLVHLRTLFDWNHRPHWYQAQSVLAWCEGMTSDAPERVAVSLELLANPDLPMGCDWSALWAVANRLAGMKGATEKQKQRGAQVAAAVDALAADHVTAIEKGLGKKGKLGTLSKGEWAGELIRFVEEFDGTPAHAAFVKANKKALEGLRKTATDALTDYHAKKEEDPAEAFAAGCEALEHGFLNYQIPEVVTQCRTWLDSGAVEVKKKERAAFEELAETYTEARKDGFAAFEKSNKKAKL